jgi:hypothetical protein
VAAFVIGLFRWLRRGRPKIFPAETILRGAEVRSPLFCYVGSRKDLSGAGYSTPVVFAEGRKARSPSGRARNLSANASGLRFSSSSTAGAESLHVAGTR